MCSSSVRRGKQLTPRGTINDRGNALAGLSGGPALQTHGTAENWKSMCEVCRAIQRIDVPAIFAALIAESLFFSKNIVRGPQLANAVADQHLGSAIRRRNQVGL